MKGLMTLLLLLLALTPVVGQQKNKVVLHNLPWETKKTLSWPDFKTVDICTDSIPDGHIEWGMVKTYISNSHSEDDGAMRAITVLKLDDCWICDKVRKDDTLLWYLQVTYDLAELYTRKLNKIYKAHPLKGMSQEEIGQLLVKSQMEIESEHDYRKTRFFEEAEHGLDKEAIVRWKEIIEKELAEQ